ncbi:MAG: DUF3857 domain-containing protein [Terracidiphilus sp.]|jgi:hypothetical protein
MRIRLSMPLFLLLLAAAAPPLLRAQFKQPTPEELKMTEDPKAPGAAAVYLYREETTDDPHHFDSFYERIKVLTEKGKEMATIHVPYEHRNFSVTDIEGRTIHSDGTVIPLTTKPSDLLGFKTDALQVNEIVFTLPSVEVGSILEYRLQIHFLDRFISSPNWEVQQQFFVHKAHYIFTPLPPNLFLTYKNSRGDTLDQIMWTTVGFDANQVIQSAARFTLDLNDIPPPFPTTTGCRPSTPSDGKRCSTSAPLTQEQDSGPPRASTGPRMPSDSPSPLTKSGARSRKSSPPPTQTNRKPAKSTPLS